MQFTKLVTKDVSDINIYKSFYIKYYIKSDPLLHRFIKCFKDKVFETIAR